MVAMLSSGKDYSGILLRERSIGGMAATRTDLGLTRCFFRGKLRSRSKLGSRYFEAGMAALKAQVRAFRVGAG